MKKTYLYSLLIVLLCTLGARAEEVTVGTGTITDNGAPFITGYRHSTTQTIYTAEELGGSGIIESIAYNCASEAPLTSNVMIYMGYKDSDTFSSANDHLGVSDVTLVYSHSKTLNSEKGWASFDLDAPFVYDASLGNLAVVVCKSASSWTGGAYYATSTQGKTISRATDNGYEYANIWTYGAYNLSNSSPNTRFEICNTEEAEVNGVTYAINTSSHLAYVADAMNVSGDVTIPATIEVGGKAYSVTKVLTSAFKDNINITSVTIPESVTSIGSAAFAGCSSLESMTLPFVGGTVNAIGSASSFGYIFGTDSYEGGVSTTQYYYINGGGNIGYYIPEKLKSVVITGGGIDSYVFQNCSSLVSIAIPESVSTIGSSAFHNCSSLTSIVIPSGLTSIGNNAFQGCNNLKKVYNLSSLSISSGSSNNGYVAYYANAIYNCTSAECVDQFYFITTKDGNNILCNYEGDSTDIILPFEYKGESYGIGSYAFEGCSFLTSITIPESVTSVGSNAFSGCLGLNNLDLPSSITTMGAAIFSGCSNLESVTVPFIVSNYPFGYYFGSSSYEGSYAANQHYQSGSSTYTTNYYLPSSLKSVTVLKSPLRSYSFENCKQLEQIILPQDIVNIPSNAFIGCVSLESIVFPETLTSIGYDAFNGCSSLTSITIPEGVTSIGQRVFSGCTSLKDLIYNARNATVYSSSGSDRSFSTAITNITIGDNVESIPAYFINSSKIKYLYIPKSVKTIGDYAFYNCPLRSVVFGTGLLSIGSTNTFNNVTKAIWLTNTPPTNYNKVSAKIHYVANDQYTSLSNKKVYSMLSSSFVVNGIKYVPTSMSGRTCEAIDCEYNNNAENINISGTVTYRNVGFKVESFNDYLCYDNDSIKSLTIGANSPDLGNYAFWDCNNITTAALAEDITSLGQYAFSGCTSLPAITIPNTVTSMGNYVFENCSSLESAIIGKGMLSVPQYAFSGCTSLPELTIPNNVTSINNYAFNGCTALQKVVFDNRETTLSLGYNGSNPLFVDCPLDTVFIGGKISYSTSKSYGYSPFYRNTSLRSIVIADNEDQIYDNEFYGCTNLQNVTIGDGVKNIGNWAFSGCSSLDYFIFGSGLETIGNEAFSDCTAITEITTRRTVPPLCGTQALEDINKWECTLRIPVENVDAYAMADQWMEFLFAEGLSGDVHTLTFNLDGKLYELDYHTHGSVIIPPTAPAREGYTFNGWEDLPSYMPDGSLTINGSYTVNPYKLNYYLDGVLYKESEVNYGTAISALAEPSKEGWYYFSGWSDVPETMPAHNVSIYGTLNPFQLGDVNDDKEISVTDVVGIGNLILGTNTEGLIRAAANVNQDETVSVADMIYECNVILGNNTIPAPSKVRSRHSIEATPSASLEMNDIVLGKDELIISLVNPYDEITGMQFDLYLPKGLCVAEEVDEFDGTTTSDITLMGRTNYANHALSSALQEDGALRILLSSQTLKTISGQEGGIIRIGLKADAETLESDATITISHVELGKTDNSCIRPEGCTAQVMGGEATGIHSMASETEGKAYELTGRKATSQTRGIVISNGRKEVRK